jgi:hypothetical protein
MSFESVKDEVVAEIHALVAKLEALFHKAAPQSPAPASAPVEVAASQTVADPATNVAPHATNPTDGLFGKGATDPNYIDPRFPNGTQAPASTFDPKKTTLDVSDAGHLFEPSPDTTYTLTGPLAVSVMVDGEEVLSEKATVSLDEAEAAPVAGAGMGWAARVGEGQHTLRVVHNVTTGRVRVQVNP